MRMVDQGGSLKWGGWPREKAAAATAGWPQVVPQVGQKSGKPRCCNLLKKSSLPQVPQVSQVVWVKLQRPRVMEASLPDQNKNKVGDESSKKNQLKRIKLRLGRDGKYMIPVRNQ